MPPPLVPIKLKFANFELAVIQLAIDFFSNAAWLELALSLNKNLVDCLAQLSQIREMVIILSSEKVAYGRFSCFKNLPLSIDTCALLSDTDRNLERQIVNLYYVQDLLLRKMDAVLAAAKYRFRLVTGRIRDLLVTLSVDADHIFHLLYSNLILQKREFAQRDYDLLSGILDEHLIFLERAKQNLVNRSKDLIADVEFHALRKNANQSFLGQDFAPAYQLAQDINYLENWSKQLDKDIVGLSAKKAEYSPYSFALAVKKILLDVKGRYQIDYYQRGESFALSKLWSTIIKCSRQYDVVSIVPAMLQELRDTEKRLRQQVTAQENELRSNYGWLAEVEASGARLWTESYYCQMANGYFDFIEELTKQGAFAGTPLATPLTPEYVSFFKNVGACSLLGIDLWLQRYLSGTTRFSVITILHQLVIPQLTSIMYALERLGVRERTALKIAPTVKWTVSLFLYGAIGLCNMGISPLSVGFLGINYLSLTILQKILDHLLNKIRMSDDAANKGWNYLVRPLVLFVGQIAHGSYVSKFWFNLVHKLIEFYDIDEEFYPDSEKLLMDSRYCLANRKACETLVLHELGVQPNATQRELKKAMNHLLLQDHSDRNIGKSDAGEKGLHAVSVVSRLRDLRSATFFGHNSTKTVPADTCENPYFQAQYR